MIRCIAAALLASTLCAAPSLGADPEPAGDPAPQQAPAPAGAPETPAKDASKDAVPEYELLYLAADADGGPQAIVRTPDRSEETWMAIGRDLRAKRPNFPILVAFFMSPEAPPVPEGYPEQCSSQDRAAFDRWTMGTYVYQSRNFEQNTTGDVIETVKQHVVSPRKRVLNGVDVIELFAQDPTKVRNSPVIERMVGVSVVVPGLDDEDLMRVARAYEDEYGTPRLLQIIFFNEEPHWADEPFMTQGLFNLAGRAYIRNSRAKDESRTEVLPLIPQWATLKDGEIIPQSP